MLVLTERKQPKKARRSAGHEGHSRSLLMRWSGVFVSEHCTEVCRGWRELWGEDATIGTHEFAMSGKPPTQLAPGVKFPNHPSSRRTSTSAVASALQGGNGVTKGLTRAGQD